MKLPKVAALPSGPEFQQYQTIKVHQSSPQLTLTTILFYTHSQSIHGKFYKEIIFHFTSYILHPFIHSLLLPKLLKIVIPYTIKLAENNLYYT